jgi:hypothetical protein
MALLGALSLSGMFIKNRIVLVDEITIRRLAAALNGAVQSFSAGYSPDAILRDSARRQAW